MTEIGAWLSPAIALPLGWTLVHSLWQGFAITAPAALLMAFSRRPSTRYLIGVSALALMLAAAVATFLVLTNGPVFTTVRQSVGLHARSFVAGFLPVAAEIRPAAAMSATGSFWPASKIMPLLVEAWLLGVGLFSLRLACGFLLLEQKRRWHANLPAQRIVDLCRQVQDRLGLVRAVRFLECDWLQAPAVIGWLRPVVLLPVTALTGLSEDQLRAVVAHELAHIRRLDCVANFLQALVEALLFYHPAVWWLGRRIRTERERCCDETALSLYDNRLEYARALSLMGEWRSAPLLAMGANRGPLSERILCVLGRESAVYKLQPVALSAGMLLVITFLAMSRVMPGSVLHVPAPEAGALARAFATQPLPRTNTAAPAVDRSRQGVSMPTSNVPALPQRLLKLTHRVHADPLPGFAEAALPVAQLPAVSALTVTDQPAPQAKPSNGELSARSDAGLTGQPTGAGDPDDLVCRQPEHLPGTQTMGPRLCRKNAAWFELWIRGETLSADGTSVLGPTTVQFVDGIPDGAGAPDLAVCAKPQHQSASRLLTPTRCFRNAYWAQLSRALPHDILPTDTGHRFLAVLDYPTSAGLTAK